MVTSAASTVYPASSTCRLAPSKRWGASDTWTDEPSTAMSPSAPTSSRSSSSSTISSGSRSPASIRMIPWLENIQATLLASPSEPPERVKRLRMAATVRFRLSVRTSSITATPWGP